MENLEKELEKLFCYCMGKEEIEMSGYRSNLYDTDYK